MRLFDCSTEGVQRAHYSEGRLLTLVIISLLSGLRNYKAGDGPPLDVFYFVHRLILDARCSKFSNLVTWKSLLLPWTGPSSPALDRRNARDILSIVQGCPNLVELEAAAGRPTGISHRIVPDTTLLRLRSISLKASKSWPLLSHITSPRLEHASFYMNGADQSIISPSNRSSGSGLAAMPTQSMSTLLALWLYGCRGFEDIIGWFEAVPSWTGLS